MHKDFRLFFSKGRGFMSRFVAWWVKSKFLSHTVGNFKVFKVDMIMESSEKGVAFAPAKYFADNNTVQAIVKPISGPLTTKEGMSEHLSWLIEKYGADSYDWMAAGSIGIFNRMKWLWKAIGGWLKTKWGKKSVQCTELWVNLLSHAGYKAVEGMQPELSDPLRLLRALSVAKTEFVIEQINPELQKEL
jgi:hypothetical protein